ncbi:sulfatase [Niabella beijingensis]|uniref:sulfatase family protein n=1 Tax=Niabella beijingensis TaxID=2872700 RepID=UPI001CC095E6|nr:sulfatase [Niabella beijingensis]MBZ4191070.1 sulfatase [Niabella beijingensis]
MNIHTLHVFFLSITLLFIQTGIGAQQPAALQPPNIIFIIGDDINWDDLGSYGNKQIRTPNLDRMAADGMRFDNFFVTASSCSPSRTSILTGRYPHNTGAAELHTPLPAGLTYFPEQLRSAGYYTALLGKWHEGPATARAYDSVISGARRNGSGGEQQWLKMISTCKSTGKPFFLWLATFDAHREWSPDSEFTITHDPRKDIRVPPTLIDDSATRRDLASYYNEIGRIDAYLGKLRATLEREGLAQNTIIIFTADNGRPFPGSKTRLQDRGLKEPFLLYWPGHAQRGAVSDALISSIDIAPTLLEIAGIQPAPSIQGTSFLPLLKQPGSPFRSYIFGEHNWHDYEAYERSVRTKDFLYIYNARPQFDNGGPIDANQSPSAYSLKQHSDKLTLLQQDALQKPRPREEFFVMAGDPLQIKNEIGNPAYQREIDSLRNKLKQWQKETGDTEPAQLTPDWYHRATGQALPQKNKRGEMPGAAANAIQNNNKGPF